MRVKIKGQSYVVKFVDKIDEEDVVGQTYLDSKIIYILVGRRDIPTAETIIHELSHAFLYECGCVKESSDEDLVSWIQRNYLDILEVFLKIYNKMDLTTKIKLTLIDKKTGEVLGETR